MARGRALALAERHGQLDSMCGTKREQGNLRALCKNGPWGCSPVSWRVLLALGLGRSDPAINACVGAGAS